MSIDRKKLACFVVGMRVSEQGQWSWCALNEDRQWLAALDAAGSFAGEKAGVFCRDPGDVVRAAAAQGLGLPADAEIVAHRLFQPSDSDEAAAVLSSRVMP